MSAVAPRLGVLLLGLAICFAAFATAPSTSSAASRSHPCAIDLPSGFPQLGALRATRVSCAAARGVARRIWTRLNRAVSNGEQVELPARVGPVRRRTFNCSYRDYVDDHGNFIYYATRCRSGRALVTLHLGS